MCRQVFAFAEINFWPGLIDNVIVGPSTKYLPIQCSKLE